MRKKFFLLGGIILGLWMSQLFLASSLSDQKIDKQGELTVVHNPEKPQPINGWKTRVRLLEELVIGLNQDQTDGWFASLNDIAVDKAGHIYTLDPKDVKIRVFDAQGELIRTFGRRGQGPGELQGPGSIRIWPNGRIVIFDVLLQRFNIFDKKGNFQRSIKAERLPIGVVKLDSRGNIYQAQITRESPQSETIRLVRYDSSLNQKVIYHTQTRKIERRVLSLYSPGYYFDLSNDDYFFWIFSPQYVVHIVDSQGKIIKKIIRQYKPRPIDRRERTKLMKKWAFRLKGLPPSIKIKFPDFYPAASGLLVDDAKRIYIRTWEEEKDGRIYYDVFDFEGRYFARFSLPPEEEVKAVRNDCLYCLIKEGESGWPLVKRYRLNWKF